MKAEDLLKAMENISDEHIQEFAVVKKKRHFYPILAACAIFILLLGSILFIALHTKNTPIEMIEPSSLESEEMTEAKLTVRVYSEKGEHEGEYIEIDPEKQPITINGIYNPILSSQDGLGISFEITYPNKDIELMTDNGYFMIWNQETGEVTNYGTQYSAQDKLKILWGPHSEDVLWQKTARLKIMVKDGRDIFLLALIKITAGEDHIFYANMEKYQDFSHKSNKNLSAESIREFFEDTQENEISNTNTNFIIKTYSFKDDNKKEKKLSESLVRKKLFISN